MSTDFIARILRRVGAAFALLALSAGGFAGTPGSVNVVGGGVLSYESTLNIINNPSCSFDIPTYLSRSVTAFSYTDARVGNPGVIANVKGVAGCSGNQINTPAVLALNDTCTIKVDVNYYNGAVTAFKSCANLIVYPKYVVMGVTYAPPGPSSSVQYSQTNSLSTTITDSSSYTSNLAISSTISTGVNLFGILNGRVNVNSGTTATQTVSSSTGTTISASNLTSYTLRGPPSPPVNINTPIDHNYDLIWLWLNPAVLYFVTPTSIQKNGFAYDMNDLVGMDIFPVPVGMLNGSIPMDEAVSRALARAWAVNSQSYPGGGNPAITAEDYPAILASHPYSTPGYAVPPTATTSADKRFTVVGSTPSGGATPLPSFVYAPGSLTQSYTNTHVNSSTVSQGVSNSRSQTIGFDYSSSGEFIVEFNRNLKVQYTQTWTNSQSTAITDTTTKVASFTIGSPCTSCAYTGPSVFEVYQDNVFGTFMFNPVR